MPWHELDLFVISPKDDNLKEVRADRFRYQLHLLPLRQRLSVLVRYGWHKVKHFCNTLLANWCLWRWGGHVGSGLNVSGYIRVHNYGKLILGNKVLLNSGPDRNYVGGDRRISFWVGKNAQLIIKDKVGISGTTIVAMKSIIIHEGTFIGGGCDIYDNDFHSIHAADRQNRCGKINCAQVEIGPLAFVGGHTIILKGVMIGEGAVIGAGSLVAHDIPAHEIWAGRPACFIRKLDSPTGGRKRY